MVKNFGNLLKKRFLKIVTVSKDMNNLNNIIYLNFVVIKYCCLNFCIDGKNKKIKIIFTFGKIGFAREVKFAFYRFSLGLFPLLVGITSIDKPFIIDNLPAIAIMYGLLTSHYTFFDFLRAYYDDLLTQIKRGISDNPQNREIWNNAVHFIGNKFSDDYKEKWGDLFDSK